MRKNGEYLRLATNKVDNDSSELTWDSSDINTSFSNQQEVSNTSQGFIYKRGALLDNSCNVGEAPDSSTTNKVHKLSNRKVDSFYQSNRSSLLVYCLLSMLILSLLIALIHQQDFIHI